MNKNQAGGKFKIKPWTIIGSFIILAAVGSFCYWMIVLDYKTPWS